MKKDMSYFSRKLFYFIDEDVRKYDMINHYMILLYDKAKIFRYYFSIFNIFLFNNLNNNDNNNFNI